MGGKIKAKEKAAWEEKRGLLITNTAMGGGDRPCL